MYRYIFLAKWLHRFYAKRLSRPSEGSVFLPPEIWFSGYFYGLGTQILQIKKKAPYIGHSVAK